MHYIQFLSKAHEILTPRSYLEIGVRNGRSLQLAKDCAVGVDPNLRIKVPLRPEVALMQLKSDDYFEQLSWRCKFDMAFVDGMHLFEFAFRDVCNVSRHLSEHGVIFIDDVLPRSHEMALRERETTHWTGDVWKVIQVIEDALPDVNIMTIDTQPTGLAMLYGKNLHKLYHMQDDHDVLVRQYANDDHPVPDHMLDRSRSVSPQDALTFMQDILPQK